MLNYLKELLTLSKLFKFKRIFGVFFSTFVVVQFSMSDSLSPLVDSLYIISHQVPFVKWFFKSFLFSFSEPRSFLCFAVASRWQLSYYIISPLPCQLLFRSFFACFCHFVEGHIWHPLSFLSYINFVQTPHTLYNTKQYSSNRINSKIRSHVGQPWRINTSKFIV